MNVLDTKTRPEPHKTADDLWFDMRCHSQYGSLWDRVEDGIALAMSREIHSSLPNDDDVRSAARQLQFIHKPRIDSVTIGNQPGGAPSWFKRDHLGMGGGENYWRTQDTFPIANRKRDDAYLRMLKNLEKARQANVIARTVNT